MFGYLYDDSNQNPLEQPLRPSLLSDSGQDSTYFIILPPVPLSDDQVGGSDQEE